MAMLFDQCIAVFLPVATSIYETNYRVYCNRAIRTDRERTRSERVLAKEKQTIRKSVFVSISLMEKLAEVDTRWRSLSLV